MLTKTACTGCTMQVRLHHCSTVSPCSLQTNAASRLMTWTKWGSASLSRKRNGCCSQYSRQAVAHCRLSFSAAPKAPWLRNTVGSRKKWAFLKLWPNCSLAMFGKVGNVTGSSGGVYSPCTRSTTTWVTISDLKMRTRLQRLRYNEEDTALQPR